MIVGEQIALELLRINAVFLRPNEAFTWASGIKSPIYCDNRLILSDIKARNYIEKALKNLIQDNFVDIDMLVGTATAGIAHAAIVADKLNLPMAYVRPSEKKHGRKNSIEGRIDKGTKVVIVEDLISTASSSIEVFNKLVEHGAEVKGIVSIFTYGMKKAIENLKLKQIKNHSLCDLDVLIEQAIKNNYIEAKDKEKLLKFRDNPQDESWMRA